MTDMTTPTETQDQTPLGAMAHVQGYVSEFSAFDDKMAMLNRLKAAIQDEIDALKKDDPRVKCRGYIASQVEAGVLKKVHLTGIAVVKTRTSLEYDANEAIEYALREGLTGMTKTALKKAEFNKWLRAQDNIEELGFEVVQVEKTEIALQAQAT